MPTKRTRTLTIAALLLYFFANQTQVGWLYVMAALMAGIVLAAGFLNRRVLRKITGQRQIGIGPDLELYEEDALEITLTLRNHRSFSAAQIQTTEHCPLAAPGSEQHAMEVFIPALPGKGSVAFSYEVIAYRRGLHTFPPLALTSPAPFGLFRSHKEIDIPSRVLVYPEVHKLRSLSLLDRQLAPQHTRLKAGTGSEVMGVRPYRPGDSPRHIHWRSVARTRQLISKEFADEAHPGLTIVLDLYQHDYPDTLTKHTPFEWAIKSAVSIAEYARRRRFPIHLIADDTALPPPVGELSWSALLQYTARAEPTGSNRLSDVMLNQTYQTFVAVLIPWPDPDIVEPLVALKQRGMEVLAVLTSPSSFPAGGPSSAKLAGEIRAAGIETCLIRYGWDWAEQLSEAVWEPVLV